ncbi:E3 ubiquitin-protein ligase CHIP [Cyclospora cayetanensis]|uniref:E3 ubiquitin-protein ligase CHIP n=1 Tax=Cyclospora cayetanensis TaxID=88456 RepID=A0A6P6S108_9EIME|nr:E3 ubiquitin-protein ligase CHIP [Cyclospora cayetanensis]
MESFFQAALNSVLEAAGAGSRANRSSDTNSGSNTESSRPVSRSNTSGGTSGRSCGNARTNRFVARASTTPIPAEGSSTSNNPQHEAHSQSDPPQDRGGGNSTAQEAEDSTSKSMHAEHNSGSSSSNSFTQSASTGGKSNGTAGVPQKGNREAANRLKDLGNESFRRCMYGLATEYYSKAIAIDATVASYFTNRALCHKRQNRYPEALQDADAALALDKTNIKGLYIKGDALVQLGNLDEGVSLLQEAEKASSLGTGRAAFEIRHSLLNARKLRHDLCQKQRSAERTDVVAFLKECIDTVAEHRQLPEEEVQERHAQLEQLVAEAEKADAPFETPDFLTCRISMGLMDEPVITPSGITYERKILLEHINHNGPTDPTTRESCEVHRLVPNYALREATTWFLERQV